MFVIDASRIYYRMLNRQIREKFSIGEEEIQLNNVLGQRYIGGGIAGNLKIKINGIPGQDLGSFMNGPSIEVFGNAQDGVANTMNAGEIIVHGKAGEIPGHSMRGGSVYIKGDVEYRAGIHMKEYRDQIPLLVIGGTAKDYCGEYMAGGRIVVLNIENKNTAAGMSIGTGIHGGAIYIRGSIDEYQLGIGAVIAEKDQDDSDFLNDVIDSFSKKFRMSLRNISPEDFVKITRKGHRPFAKLYTPALNIKSAAPKHLNLTPPCTFNCPSGIPTPVYFNLIKDGKVREAQLLMDEFSPFRMSVCGTVCPAPCMSACSRGAVDNPVEIQKLAREYYPDFNPVVAAEKRGELVSVIGAGPAGISCAWQLARKGYRVKMYEASSDIGGKVRMAIPEERLPEENLQRDIRRIKSLPIEFVLKTKVDKALFEKIYMESEAVVVATGAHIPRRISYPGGERIVSGLDFLVGIAEGRALAVKGKNVLIIGAGNVGMDVACEAWRLRARSVTAVDIQKPLAFGRELDMAVSLGTKILWPRRIQKLDKNRVYFDDGTEIEADIVIISIGESPDTSFLPDSVMVNEKGYIAVSEKSFRSSDPKVYTCGDVTKPGLVTDAIGTGRYASMQVSADLSGTEFVYPEKHLIPKRRINAAYFGGEESDVDKCISCGTCIFCDKCIEACPQKAITRNGEIFTVDAEICTSCYTCVNVCPRGAIQNTDVTF